MDRYLPSYLLDEIGYEVEGASRRYLRLCRGRGPSGALAQGLKKSLELLSGYENL
ncbi:hypothetical protein ACFL2Q_03725 [Thermodesulfobacteriota bacterium]